LTFFCWTENVEWFSPSPDGQYIVFERRLGSGDGATHGLWIMERGNPANMWLLTSGSKPDWSRANPSVPTQPTNTPTPQPGATNTPTPGESVRIHLPVVQR
jgi:dipeptidyl aminopeptidase/acylaminoacyl peptidase